MVGSSLSVVFFFFCISKGDEKFLERPRRLPFFFPVCSRTIYLLTMPESTHGCTSVCCSIFLARVKFFFYRNICFIDT
jgi:hypothetical protein